MQSVIFAVCRRSRSNSGAISMRQRGGVLVKNHGYPAALGHSVTIGDHTAHTDKTAQKGSKQRGVTGACTARLVLVLSLAVSV
jgi:hypothetical protein